MGGVEQVGGGSGSQQCEGGAENNREGEKIQSSSSFWPGWRLTSASAPCFCHNSCGKQTCRTTSLAMPNLCRICLKHSQGFKGSFCDGFRKEAILIWCKMSCVAACTNCSVALVYEGNVKLRIKLGCLYPRFILMATLNPSRLDWWWILQIVVETGLMGRQANGAVTVTDGETVSGGIALHTKTLLCLEGWKRLQLGWNIW